MAQRNEIGRALRALDGGNARDTEHVALARIAGANERERGGGHRDAAAGARETIGYILGGDIDHVRLTRRVEVRKMSFGGGRALRAARRAAAIRPWERADLRC